MRRGRPASRRFPRDQRSRARRRRDLADRTRRRRDPPSPSTTWTPRWIGSGETSAAVEPRDVAAVRSAPRFPHRCGRAHRLRRPRRQPEPGQPRAAAAAGSDVFGQGAYELTLREVESLHAENDGRSVPVVRTAFEIRTLATDVRTRFEITSGTSGDLAGVPVAISWQPRWWLRVSLRLDRNRRRADPGMMWGRAPGRAHASTVESRHAGAPDAPRAPRHDARRGHRPPRCSSGPGTAPAVRRAVVPSPAAPGRHRRGAARQASGARHVAPRHAARDDRRRLRALPRAAAVGARSRHAGLGDRTDELEMAPVLTLARAFFGQPRTFDAFRDHLAATYPDGDVRAMAYATRMLLPLLQVPTEHRGPFPRRRTSSPRRHGWARRRRARRRAPKICHALPRRLRSGDGRRRAGVVGMQGLRAVFDTLRPQLVSFRGERGGELFDLPDAPRPDADVPAPVRLLPEWDNAIVGRADARLLPPQHRSAVFQPGLRVLATFSWTASSSAPGRSSAARPRRC